MKFSLKFWCHCQQPSAPTLTSMSRKTHFYALHWFSIETTTSSAAVGDFALSMANSRALKDARYNFHITEKVTL